jgi:hypothetical protein
MKSLERRMMGLAATMAVMAVHVPVDLPDGVANLLQQHALNGAQRQADGAAAYAENLRYDYLNQKNRVSFADATGVRHVEESGSGRARNIDNTAVPKS